MSKEQFKYIEDLVNQGQLSEAMRVIKSLEDTQLSENENLYLLYLKTLWYNELGNVNEVLNSATQLLNQSRASNNHLRELDAIINFIRAYKKSYNIGESLKYLQTGRKLLEQIDTLEKSSGIEKRRGTLLYQEGILYLHDHKLEEAYKSLTESLILRKELNDQKGMAESYMGLGAYYKYKGKYSKVLENFQKSLELNQKVEYKKGIASSLKSVGGYFLSQGELNRAYEYLQKSLSIVREMIGDQEETANIFNILGIIFIYRGELDKALSTFHKSIKIYEDINNKSGKATLLNNIGQTYCEMGEYQKARDCYNDALDLSRQNENDWMIMEVLFNLIKYFGSGLKPEDLTAYLDEMKELTQKHEKDQMLSQKYRLSQANILKQSDRLADKSKALTIYQQVAYEEMVWYELTVDAMLNLGNLLLYELEVTGKAVVLKEIRELVTQLRVLAEAQQSHWLLAAIFLLESKLALLELDLEKAQRSLSQAEQITSEKGLHKLASTIAYEIEFFESQIENWKKYISQEASMDERIELTQISTLLERLIDRRLFYDKDEIYNYTEEAKKVVAKWQNSS